MDRIELLRARIALYRRYLREGVDDQLAVGYLWLIRQDEIELTALVAALEKAAEAQEETQEAQPPADPSTPKDDR